jgi:hypothetical protein
LPLVVDTNVLPVANGTSTQTLRLPGCVAAAVTRLEEIKAQETVVLDSAWKIIKEYQANVDTRNQRGPGTVFLRWLLQNRTTNRCREITITPSDPNDENQFAEFPNDPALTNFDPSDRKFVAVALAHGQQYSEEIIPPILNAVDSDWVDYETILNGYGVVIEFLCGRELKI